MSLANEARGSQHTHTIIVLKTDNNTLRHFYSALARFAYQVLGRAARKAVKAAAR